MRIVINGTLPGLNEYTKANRANRYLGAKMKREAEDVVRFHLIQQARGKKVTSPVRLHFTWLEPTRRRDPDNIASAKKYILDAFVRSGLLPNDTQRWVKGFTDDFGVDRDHPRIEVEIREEGKDAKSKHL